MLFRSTSSTSRPCLARWSRPISLSAASLLRYASLHLYASPSLYLQLAAFLLPYLHLDVRLLPYLQLAALRPSWAVTELAPTGPRRSSRRSGWWRLVLPGHSEGRPDGASLEHGSSGAVAVLAPDQAAAELTLIWTAAVVSTGPRRRKLR